MRARRAFLGFMLSAAGLLLGRPAVADTPITEPDIKSAVDRYLGPAFSGQTFTAATAKQKANELLRLIGKKGTSTGTVFDAVQTWNGVLFGIESPSQRRRVSGYMKGQLAALARHGDGGMNAVAAKSMNEVFGTLFFGQQQGIKGSDAWKSFQSLRKTTRDPALDVVNGMFHHYLDVGSPRAANPKTGMTENARLAAKSWTSAAAKIVGAGQDSSVHARQLLKAALDYANYYQGTAYNTRLVPFLTNVMGNQRMSRKEKVASIAGFNRSVLSNRSR